MSSTLYRKYRPKKFSEIVGQKHIVKTLSNAISLERIGQAYLFTGPRGTGKTTLARIFAKTVNCKDIQKSPKNSISAEPCLKCSNCKQFKENRFTDIIEIDAASNTGVDNIRDLRETAKLSPLQGKFKVYIIDEVHMLSQGAFNALLKILEEPPKHIIFILATTEIHKVPETIISRCQKFDFSKFTLEEIINKLSDIAKKEKIKIDKEALEIIALMAEGGMRDAESLLEQVITLEKNNITAQKIESLLGVSGSQSMEKMTELVFDNRLSESLLFLNQIYKDGYNLEIFSKGWLEYLRKIMLIKFDSELENTLLSSLTKSQLEKIKGLSEKTDIQLILYLIERLSDALLKIKTSFIPQLPLEYILIDISQKNKPSENNFIKNDIQEDKIKDNNSPTGEEIPQQRNSKLIKKTETEEKTTIQEEERPKKTASSPIDMGKIRQSWKKITEEIGINNCSLSMMLSNSKPIESTVSPETVLIVVKHSFQKDLVNKPENRLTIRDISNKITGLDFKVEATTEAESGIKLKTVLTANSCQTGNNSEEKNENSQGSLLADAMNLMGGKIIESQEI